jgi:hypothetical protein
VNHIGYAGEVGLDKALKANATLTELYIHYGYNQAAGDTDW